MRARPDVKRLLLPLAALVLWLAALALFLPFPRAALIAWPVRMLAQVVTDVLLLVALLVRSRRVSWLAGLGAVAVATVALGNALAIHHDVRKMYRLHAVAREACRGRPVSSRADDVALERALPLAALHAEDTRWMTLTCSDEGPTVALWDGFDPYAWVDAQGRFR